jgi:hypothetical protein
LAIRWGDSLLVVTAVSDLAAEMGVKPSGATPVTG